MSVAAWVRAPSGGVWTPIGEVGYPRLRADSVHLEADDWGASTGSFVVDLPSAHPSPLLVPFAPIRFEIDGTKCWSGRVVDAIRAGRQVGVDIQGSQNLLDEPLPIFHPVDDRLTMWADDYTKVDPNTPHTQNTIQSNAIRLGWDQARTDINTIGGGQPAYNAVTYLRRPANIAAVIVTLHVPNAVTSLRFDIFSSGGYLAPESIQNDEVGFALGLTPPSVFRWAHVDISAGGNFTIAVSGTVATAGVLSMGLALQTGTGGLASVPQGTVAKITGITVFDTAAYMDATNAVSQMHSSDVAPRVVQMVPSLSRDLAAIKPTSAAIPTFYYDGQPPRTIMQDAAVFDDAIRKVDVDDRLVLAPRPATPTVTLGSRSPASQETPIDPSNLISGVLLTFTRGQNAPQSEQVSIPTQLFSVLDLPETPRVSVSTAGPLKGGIPYQIGPWNGPDTYDTGIALVMGDNANWTRTMQPCASTYLDANGLYWATFMPAEDWATPAFMYNAQTIETDFGTRGFTIYQAAGALAGVGRVGSLQLPISLAPHSLIPKVQAYLRAQNRLGYTETRDVADGRAYDATSGLPLPAFALLLHAGEYARLADRLDPQDGKIGAVGVISGVAYDHAGRRAAVSVGQRYGDVDEMLARLQAKVRQ